METKTLKTACGNTITITEDTRTHLAAHPEAWELLEEAVAKVTLPESGFLLTTVDLGRVIGRNACVEASKVQANEPALFACRTGRDVPSRVVTGVEKPETSEFSIIAGRQDDGTWLLYTGFAGPVAPREPHDVGLTNGNEAELEFWCRHALVYDEGWGEVYESTWEAELEGVAAKRAAKAEVEA